MALTDVCFATGTDIEFCCEKCEVNHVLLCKNLDCLCTLLVPRSLYPLSVFD